MLHFLFSRVRSLSSILAHLELIRLSLLREHRFTHEPTIGSISLNTACMEEMEVTLPSLFTPVVAVQNQGDEQVAFPPPTTLLVDRKLQPFLSPASMSPLPRAQESSAGQGSRLCLPFPWQQRVGREESFPPLKRAQRAVWPSTAFLPSDSPNPALFTQDEQYVAGLTLSSLLYKCFPWTR